MKIFIMKFFVPILTSGCLLIPIHSNATVVDPDVKKTVAFIYIDTSSGQVPNGTGFFLSLNQSSGTFLYLITAKHVLMNDESHPYPQIHLRLNSKAQGKGTEWYAIPLIGGSAPPVFLPSDPDVDLAAIAMPFVVGKTFEVKSLDLSMLANPEIIAEERITEGDDMFFTGLFTPFPGEHRIYPIVRFGRLAMLPSERIPWKTKKKKLMLDLLLMETQAFGGNSGSPAFFSLGGNRHPGVFVAGGRSLVLAGLIMGYFGARNPIELADSKSPTSSENLGIAAVIPAEKIREVLYTPEAIRWRDLAIRDRMTR